MARSGDWLIPHVNGLPRYDKPPLVYWLMAGFYSLPGSSHWDPLGTWAARLPSALATISTMVLIADTLLRWPQQPSGHGSTAMSGALAFALGPLILVWGRTEVSDALFTATIAFTFLLSWRTYAATSGPWWPCWLALALAVLTKGPVSLVLYSLTLALFLSLGAETSRLWKRLRPLPGLTLTLALSTPWYVMAVWREGQPYWDSFFGYHNLQRYTRVVNNHSQGWWYFLAVLLLAGLPFTPLVLLSLGRSLRQFRTSLAPSHSLARFATAWLLTVLLFFSASATKLPSYWLVATPAGGLLVALALPAGRNGSASSPCRGLSISAGLLLGLSAGLVASPLWLGEIHDPTLPGLQGAIASSHALPLGALITFVSALLLAGFASSRPSVRLVQSQAALLLMGPLVLLPVWTIGDRLRGVPIRDLAAVAVEQLGEQENLAMMGMRKPSLHFYSRATVIFEGRSATALVNLADRLQQDNRPGLHPVPAERQPTVVLIIDNTTASEPHWQGWIGKQLAFAGSYRLWRVDRRWLEQRAFQLRAQGNHPNWRDPRPERF